MPCYKYGNCARLFKNGYWFMTLTKLMAMDVVVVTSASVLGRHSFTHLLKDDSFVIYETSG
jgi:hypothetical protein